MQDREQGPMDYLAGAEASHLATQAGPGVIYIHLRREIESEQARGRPARRMFIELELGQAVRHWRDLGELIRQAGALERPK
ncbi:MAG: hypothetical protein M3Y41_15760 [Pseudomonadota bacterium]|nr:hypothetical protein [Pseudomonadota bacterium]